jgi:cytochrome c553
VPRFSLTPEEKRAIVAFLTARPIRSSPAPAHAAEVALKRFQCLACHERNGQGGLTSAITEMLRRYEGVENAEAVTPPPLTGIGDKLTTSWIRAVLLEGARSRPWMALRMPRFGPGNIGHLPAGLLACDGITDTHDMTPELSDFEPLPREEDIQAGRLLVGKKAFGCIGCHDIAGVPSSGTRGPDLAAMTQRVRYPWYRRWLVQPQRIQPGTRMPTVFNEGRTLLDDILGGDASRQADAIWSYLAIGPTLPLPDGLEPPPGLVLSVRDRPVLLRTFLPDVGPRSIAVGYPQHVNVAYDAAQCRPAYAWSGNFLDASPVWNDRGGNPAKILGTRFWQAPAGFPWFFTRGDELPDILGRPRDPAYGASPQEGNVYAGPRLLRFAGIRFDPAASDPIFVSEATLGENLSCRIEERLEPLRDSYGVGIRRTFRLPLASDHSAWLLLSEARMPRFLSDRGQAVPVRAGEEKHPAKAGAVLVGEPSGKANVTVLDRVPEGSELRLLPTRDGKAVFLFIPTPADQVVQVSHWQPYRPVAPPP